MAFIFKRKSSRKLVRVIEGEVFDVGVDLRRNSPTFGKWFGVILSAENKSNFTPEGFAHGFAVLSEMATLFINVLAYTTLQMNKDFVERS